jgi:tetratricopeptide (TPR) repeat protein
MSKKKRKKGNTAGSVAPRSRPSLPEVSSPSSAPPPRAAAPPASAPVASAGPAMTARSPSHNDLLVGTTSESSAAEELAAAPSPSEVPPRDDDQEESGPRIVAFAPTKDEKPAAKAEKADKPEKTDKADKTDKAPKTEKKAEKADAKAEKKADAKEKATRDDSLPAPAVELDHESFFEAGEKADKEHRAVARGVIPHDHDHEHEVDLHVKHKMSPAVRERRARFTKYVKWAVGASAIVCLAALIRVTVARGHADTSVGTGGSQAAEISQSPLPTPVPVAAPVPEPATAQAAPTPPVVAADPPATAPAPTDTAAAPGAAPGAAAVPGAAATAPAPASDTPTDPVAAKEEKVAARKALERGDMKGAIEAGERSVALDPTDGDAWLLLGAAYQERGKGADARRAFTACVKQGKRGAIGECAAMLR